MSYFNHIRSISFSLSLSLYVYVSFAKVLMIKDGFDMKIQLVLHLMIDDIKGG
ncbi:hypothetical protein Scep_015468 [Stephania cephalantha]|uniref:Uncharacterized protein n=1 Tax=Stephania cephalantha TaxID=152367 RepID=A0AAP0P0E2_9MAGN